MKGIKIGSKVSKGDENVVRKRKIEKIWVVGYFQVRRHSRVLYLPLPPEVVSIHQLKKGDTIKAMLVAVKRAPDPDDEVTE